MILNSFSIEKRKTEGEFTILYKELMNDKAKFSKCCNIHSTYPSVNWKSNCKNETHIVEKLPLIQNAKTNFGHVVCDQ